MLPAVQAAFQTTHSSHPSGDQGGKVGSFFIVAFFPEPTISRLGDQFLCTDCEALCDSLEAIANHMNRDHKKRSDQWENKKYKCEQCIVPFSFKSTWLTHMQRKHGTHFAFKCNYCDFKCNRKAQVTSHVEEAHKLTASPGVRQGFKCRICGVIFLTKEPLISHIKTIHSDVMQTQSQSHQAPQNKALGQLNTTYAEFTNLTPATDSPVANDIKLEVETDFGIRPSDDGPQENENQDPLAIDGDVNPTVNNNVSNEKEAITAVNSLMRTEKEAVDAITDLLSTHGNATSETPSFEKPMVVADERVEATEREEKTSDEKLPGNVRLLPEEKLEGKRILLSSASFRPMVLHSQPARANKTQTTAARSKRPPRSSPPAKAAAQVLDISSEPSNSDNQVRRVNLPSDV